MMRDLGFDFYRYDKNCINLFAGGDRHLLAREKTSQLAGVLFRRNSLPQEDYQKSLGKNDPS